MRQLPLKFSLWGSVAMVISYLLSNIFDEFYPDVIVATIPSLLITFGVCVITIFSGWLTRKFLIAGGILQFLIGVVLFLLLLVGFASSTIGSPSPNMVKTLIAGLAGPIICGGLLLISSLLIFLRRPAMYESRPPNDNLYNHGFTVPDARNDKPS